MGISIWCASLSQKMRGRVRYVGFGCVPRILSLRTRRFHLPVPKVRSAEVRDLVVGPSIEEAGRRAVDRLNESLVRTPFVSVRLASLGRHRDVGMAKQADQLADVSVLLRLSSVL